MVDKRWTVGELRSHIAKQQRQQQQEQQQGLDHSFTAAQVRLFLDHSCTVELKASKNQEILGNVQGIEDGKTLVLVVRPRWKDCATGDMLRPQGAGRYVNCVEVCV